MATARWTVDVDGAAHEVVLEWTYWGGDRSVYVDGGLVDSDSSPLRWKSDQAVDVAGKPCTVITRPKPINRAAFDVVLVVDGQERRPA